MDNQSTHRFKLYVTIWVRGGGAEGRGHIATHLIRTEQSVVYKKSFRSEMFVSLSLKTLAFLLHSIYNIATAQHAVYLGRFRSAILAPRGCRGAGRLEDQGESVSVSDSRFELR